MLGPRTLDDRNAVAGTGASIDYSEHGVLHISATTAEARAIERLGFRLEPVPAQPAPEIGTTGFPPADSNYHDYAELTAVVNQVVADPPASPARSASAARTRVGTSWA